MARDEDEVGDRAARALKNENTGPADKRRAAIAARGVVARMRTAARDKQWGPDARQGG